MKRTIVLAGAGGVLLAGLIAGVPHALGSASAVALDGSFSTVVVRPRFEPPTCPYGIVCGTIQLNGLGSADWVYVFGPTLVPDGRCFDVDGTFTLTLQSDGSELSGPLTGLNCPGPSDSGRQHGGPISYGNPFREDDVITFTDGTGQFAGLTGTATFRTALAGARFSGVLTGSVV